ncbi:MAG: hypothetical protein LC777_21400 [Actinobacteria bacterium]|nr:hypothetical protein [Actinomycetota bacterium]
MPAPAAAALGAGRLAGVALSNRRMLLWLALLLFGVALAFIALLAAILGGLSADAHRARRRERLPAVGVGEKRHPGGLPRDL